MKENKIKKSSILLIIFMMVLVIIVGTYAWFTYRSNKTAMVLTIGEINNVQVTLSPYQIKANISSQTTYTSNNYTSVTAINNSNSNRNVRLYYKIDNIDSELISSNFKYTIERSTNGTTYSQYKTGNFSTASNGGKLTILEESIPGATTYNYKVYIWLDGTTSGQNNIIGKTFNGELRAEILSYNVTFDANGGIVNISNKVVSYGEQYGELPTPTRTGYTFLGWNGSNILNPNTMLITRTSYIASNDEFVFDDKVYDRIMSMAQWVPKTNTSYTLVMQILENSFDQQISLNTDERFYISQYNNRTINLGTTGKFISTFTTRSDFSNVTLGSLWFWTRNTVTGNFRTKLAMYEGDIILDYEPYYITSDTTVVQNKNHTLTAIWQENR